MPSFVPSPSDFFLRGLRQQGFSLTVGVFLGAALTSGAVCGALAFVVANERLLRRAKDNVTALIVAARDTALGPPGLVGGGSIHRIIQSEINPPNGNALQACVASILRLPLARVPNFVAEPDYWDSTQTFGRDHGLAFVKIALQAGALPHPSAAGVLCILRGHSPRSPNGGHVVVAKVGADGQHFEEVHDPYPGGGGLVGEPVWAAFFTMAEPKAR